MTDNSIDWIHKLTKEQYTIFANLWICADCLSTITSRIHQTDTYKDVDKFKIDHLLKQLDLYGKKLEESISKAEKEGKNESQNHA